jgi:hypothetical protein
MGYGGSVADGSKVLRKTQEKNSGEKPRDEK